MKSYTQISQKLSKEDGLLNSLVIYRETLAKICSKKPSVRLPFEILSFFFNDSKAVAPKKYRGVC